MNSEEINNWLTEDVKDNDFGWMDGHKYVFRNIVFLHKQTILKLFIFRPEDPFGFGPGFKEYTSFFFETILIVKTFFDLVKLIKK